MQPIVDLIKNHILKIVSLTLWKDEETVVLLPDQWYTENDYIHPFREA